MFRTPNRVCGPEDFYKQIFDPDEFTNKLNCGCGAQYLEGFVNLDGNTEVRADVYHDLESMPLPFEDGSFDLIYAAHILEHIHNLPMLKKEFNRITRFPAGIVVVVPYYLSRDAWGDDTHIRAFSELSFNSAFWPGFRYLNHQVIDMIDGDGLKNQWLIGCLGKNKV